MTRHSLPLSIVVAIVLASPGGVIARNFNAGLLHIGHPWVKAPPNGAPTAGGYLTVTNRGKTADRLLGGSSPAVQALQPHSMSMAGGVMRMRALPKGWEILPGATLTLAPGGDHLMLIGPRKPLKVGDHIPATLDFAHAGAVKVEFIVQAQAPAGAMPKTMPLGAMPGVKMR